MRWISGIYQRWARYRRQRRAYRQMWGWPELLGNINSTTRHRESDR
jgi:hypothetical protein